MTVLLLVIYKSIKQHGCTGKMGWGIWFVCHRRLHTNSHLKNSHNNQGGLNLHFSAAGDGPRRRAVLEFWTRAVKSLAFLYPRIRRTRGKYQMKRRRWQGSCCRAHPPGMPVHQQQVLRCTGVCVHSLFKKWCFTDRQCSLQNLKPRLVIFFSKRHSFMALNNQCKLKRDTSVLAL